MSLYQLFIASIALTTLTSFSAEQKTQFLAPPINRDITLLQPAHAVVPNITSPRGFKLPLVTKTPPPSPVATLARPNIVPALALPTLTTQSEKLSPAKKLSRAKTSRKKRLTQQDSWLGYVSDDFINNKAAFLISMEQNKSSKQMEALHTMCVNEIIKKMPMEVQIRHTAALKTFFNAILKATYEFKKNPDKC